MEYSLPYRFILLVFYPVRVGIHLAVFVFWGIQFYLFPSHTPEIRHVRNETLLILAGIGIVLITALWNTTAPQKLMAGLAILITTFMFAQLLNAGDEGFLN